MRKTKIIATIGPACEDEKVLKEMCLAGMNVARLNFSHGDEEDHLRKIALVKKVREELRMPIAILLDTKGPEYRIRKFDGGKITLEEGDTFCFTTEQILGDKNRVSVNYPDLIQELNVGDTILVNNGLVACEVMELKETEAVCKVVTGGVLSDNKSMNFPNKVLKGEYLSKQDKEDLLFGIEHEVDFVAASFVSNGEDMRSVKEFLTANGGGDIDIIAKIENQSGVDHIEEICEIADGVMIARGDLGVEIPYVKLPAIQKSLTEKCRLMGKRVITATEMLESMITNPRPTRAEISDVANAVYSGTSAVMLSGESAAGKHPVESVRTMAEIAEYTEADIDYAQWFRNTEYVIKDNVDAISHGTCAMAIDVHAKGIVVNSVSGVTARMVSRFRCPVDIIGTTTSKRVFYKLNLSWGVYPVLCDEYDSIDVMFYQDVIKAKEAIALEPGDNLVLTGGRMTGKSGNTNMIKIETVC